MAQTLFFSPNPALLDNPTEPSPYIKLQDLFGPIITDPLKLQDTNVFDTYEFEELINNKKKLKTLDQQDPNFQEDMINLCVDFPYDLSPRMTYIKCKINDKSTYAMIDTGSSLSLMTQEMSRLLGVKVLPIEKTIHARMANGSKTSFTHGAYCLIDYKNAMTAEYFLLHQQPDASKHLKILLGSQAISKLRLMTAPFAKRAFCLYDREDRKEIELMCRAFSKEQDEKESYGWDGKDITGTKNQQSSKPKKHSEPADQKVDKDSPSSLKDDHKDPNHRSVNNNTISVNVNLPEPNGQTRILPSDYSSFLKKGGVDASTQNDGQKVVHDEINMMDLIKIRSELKKSFDSTEVTIRRAQMALNNDIDLCLDSTKLLLDREVDLNRIRLNPRTGVFELTEENTHSLFNETLVKELQCVHLTKQKRPKKGLKKYLTKVIKKKKGQERASKIQDDQQDHYVNCCQIINHVHEEVQPNYGLKYYFPDLETMTPGHREDIVPILKEFEGSFEHDLQHLTRSNMDPIEIKFTQDLPQQFKDKNFHLNPTEARIIHEFMDDQLKAGLVEPTDSPYSSNLFLTTKVIPENQTDRLASMSRKDYEAMKYRAIIDYRTLNKYVLDDHKALPYPNEIRDYIKGAKWVTVIDVRSGYSQSTISKKCRKVLAFNAAGQHLQPTVLPQGCKASPSLYQKAMEKILEPYLRKCCLVYLDDCLVWSDSWEQHMIDLRAVLERYRLFNIKLNPAKCRIAQQKVKYLGHVIDANGTTPDPKKVEAVQKMYPPQTLKQLQRFNGLLNYHSKYIPNYSELIAPLTNLVKELNPLVIKKADGKHSKKPVLINEWREEHQRSFEKLKEIMSTKPFLVHFDPEKKHVVSCDASGTQVAGILKQIEIDPLTGKEEERVVEYFSRKLNPTEQRYISFEKELLAVRDSVINWHHWLWGDKEFIVESDSSAVALFKKQAKLKPKKPLHNRRVLEWRMQLAEFTGLVYKHKKGTLNKDADAVSRLGFDPSEDDVHCIAYSELVMPSDHLYQLQCEDPFIQEKIRQIYSPESVDLYVKITEEYELVEGLLFKIVKDKKTGNKRSVFVLPEKLIFQILMEAHDNALQGGHLGFWKTLNRIQNFYWFPDMHSWILRYIMTCQSCTRNKPKNYKSGAAQPLSFEFEGTLINPFDYICIDAMDLTHVKSGHYKYALVACDILTGFIICKPVTNLKYPAIVDFFFQHVFNYGIPKMIISDNATSFKNIKWNDFCDQLTIDRRYINPYHSQSNGIAERAIRTFKEMAKAYCETNQKIWPKVLSAVQVAYNTAVRKGQNYSPYFLLFGHEAKMGAMREYNVPEGWADLKDMSAARSGETALEFMQRIKKLRDNACKALISSRHEWKKKYDRFRRVNEFKDGDLVVKKVQVRPKGTASAFFAPYSKPFRVVKIVTPLVVLLMDEDDKTTHKCHVSFLKKYSSRDNEAGLVRLQRLNEDFEIGSKLDENGDPVDDPNDQQASGSQPEQVDQIEERQEINKDLMTEIEGLINDDDQTIIVGQDEESPPEDDPTLIVPEKEGLSAAPTAPKKKSARVPKKISPPVKTYRTRTITGRLPPPPERLGYTN